MPRCVFVLASLVWPGWLLAATFNASPGSNLQSLLNGMSAGDELVLSAGTYNTSNLNISGKNGTSTSWFTVRAATGATVILNNTGGNNMFNVAGSKFWRFQKLEIKGGASGEDGIKWTGTCTDMLVEDCYIHNIGGVAINCSSITRMDRLTVRHCHIHNTGGTGEGMYLGKNGGGGPVLSSIIENNWVHDTGGSQGDGIEFNEGCLGNVVRDNVVYNTAYPCIFIENTAAGSANIVERNACWNCTTDSVCQVNGNAIVRNNLFFNGSYAALNMQSGAGIEVYNNVFYDTARAVRFPPVSIKFCNNIVDGTSENAPSGTVSNNYWKSTSYGSNPITAAPGYFPASMDFYPRHAAYKNAAWNGDSDVPTGDFNTLARTTPYDVGAYEITTATNSGWQVQANFKVNSPSNTPPMLTSAPWATPNPMKLR